MATTALIRIEDEGDRPPVRLYEDRGREDWLSTAVASGELPNLPVPHLPLQLDAEGPAAMRAFLLASPRPTGGIVPSPTTFASSPRCMRRMASARIMSPSRPHP